MSEVRMTWNGQQISDRVAKAAVRGLANATEALLTDANQIIPIETGEMMRGGVADVDERRLEGTVSYGHNSSAAYVVKQHEDTTLRHDEGREPKWLERTLNNNRSKYQGAVTDEIRRELRG